MRTAILFITFTASISAADKLPAPGAVFQVSPDAPKYVTVDIEFRDPTEAKWPNFFYGKPAEKGSYTFDPKSPAVKLNLKADHATQLKGDQSRRIVGEWIKDEKSPAIAFVVKSSGTLVTEQMKVEEKGKKVMKPREVLPIDGELIVDGKAFPVKAKGFVKYITSNGKETADTLTLDVRFQITGKTLGLKASGSAGPIDVRVSTTAYVELPTGKNK